MSTIYKIGSILRISLQVHNDQYNMDDYDFEVELYVKNTDKKKIFTKNECVRESENKYILILDTSGFSVGEIKYVFTAHITTQEGEVKPIILDRTCIKLI